jgi:hypothetical protein
MVNLNGKRSSAAASDNVAIASVQFTVGGSNVGAPVTSLPYTTAWNSTGVPDGPHTILAVAHDAAGNYATSTVVAVTVDNTAPTISSIASSSVASSAQTITWTTNEAATSQVSYGTTLSYGSASSSAVLATSHSITLTGLTASTVYDFQVSSTDAAGNLATSSNQTFTTPPGWVQNGASTDLDFADSQYYGGSLSNLLQISRTATNATATDLLPTSPAGATYNTYAPNTLRITPGVGLLIEEIRINYLLNSTAPATQTTASLATGTYTLWVNGSGSATMSSGTGTGCGTGVATNGTPVTFTITIAGTCTVTVAGSLNAFQLEKSLTSAAFGTEL